jgi:hypothetical protein
MNNLAVHNADCRIFVEDSQHIGEEMRYLINFFLERLSLRGICRVAGVSFREEIE